MWRAVRTPYGGPVPTPRDSAVANQLIGLEDWGGLYILGWGVCYRSGAYSAPSPGVSESCRWSGALLFGMGNSLSGVGHQSLEWGFSFWCGQLSFRCGAFVCGVGNCNWSGNSLFDVGNSIRSGALTIGVGNCDRSGEFVTGVGRISWSPSAVLRET